MITKESLRDLLQNTELGFVKSPVGDSYTKSFPNYDNCQLKVDFDAEQLFFPTAIVGGDRNTGFDHNENFVVFECVNRLLEKGYRPETIELEKVWALVHEQKGGRADICVYSPDRSSMLFILECKTFGTEFKKALKETKADGGQIFSYWQQERTTKCLGIYASDFHDGKIVHECPVVNCSDDANIVKLAKKDESVRIYSNPNVAGNAQSLFEVWTETYKQAFLDNLIFDDDTVAYEIITVR